MQNCLTPGSEYTGGKAFFEGDFSLIRRIRSDEIGTSECPLLEAPDSLLEAMRIFFIGVAVGLLNGGKDNRSMMIHPSKETEQHASYALWVESIKLLWSSVLTEKDIDSDDLISEFRKEYDDLAKTVDDIPIF